MIRAILYLVISIFVSACANVQPPLASNLKERIKNEKTVVAFIDSSNRIHYTEDHYLVFGIAKTASDSVYEGFWNSNKELSKIHAQELSKIGLNATSIFDLGDLPQINKLIDVQNKNNVVFSANPNHKDDRSPVVDPFLNSILREKGFSNLIMITWSGFYMNINPLGVKPIEFINNSYYLYNLNNGKLIWNGDIISAAKVEIPGGNAKAFLEEDQLQGLKTEVGKLIRKRYRDKNLHGGTVGQIIGIED